MGKLRSQVEKYVGEGIYESLDLLAAVLEGTFNLILEFATLFQSFLLLYGIGELIIWLRVAIVDMGDLTYIFVSTICVALTILEGAIDFILSVRNFFTGHHRKPLPLLESNKIMRTLGITRNKAFLVLFQSIVFQL